MERVRDFRLNLLDKKHTGQAKAFGKKRPSMIEIPQNSMTPVSSNRKCVTPSNVRTTVSPLPSCLATGSYFNGSSKLSSIISQQMVETRSFIKNNNINILDMINQDIGSKKLQGKLRMASDVWNSRLNTRAKEKALKPIGDKLDKDSRFFNFELRFDGSNIFVLNYRTTHKWQTLRLDIFLEYLTIEVNRFMTANRQRHVVDLKSLFDKAVKFRVHFHQEIMHNVLFPKGEKLNRPVLIYDFFNLFNRQFNRNEGDTSVILVKKTKEGNLLDAQFLPRRETEGSSEGMRDFQAKHTMVRNKGLLIQNFRKSFYPKIDEETRKQQHYNVLKSFTENDVSLLCVMYHTYTKLVSANLKKTSKNIGAVINQTTVIKDKVGDWQPTIQLNEEQLEKYSGQLLVLKRGLLNKFKLLPTDPYANSLQSILAEDKNGAKTYLTSKYLKFISPK